MKTTMHRVFRSRWWMPALSVALGVAILVAARAGGDPAFEVFGLGLMTALGAVFLLGVAARRLSGLSRRRPARCTGRESPPRSADALVTPASQVVTRVGV